MQENQDMEDQLSIDEAASNNDIDDETKKN